MPYLTPNHESLSVNPIPNSKPYTNPQSQLGHLQALLHCHFSHFIIPYSRAFALLPFITALQNHLKTSAKLVLTVVTLIVSDYSYS